MSSNLLGHCLDVYRNYLRYSYKPINSLSPKTYGIMIQGKRRKKKRK